MSNLTLFSNPALQSQQSNVNKFNLVTHSNTFNAVFNTQPLDEIDAINIEKIVVDSMRIGAISEDQAQNDITQLKQITAEIKSIGQQGIILIGERIYRARGVLKSYKDGTFTKWLELTLGSKRTGYNMLAYYELYKELPSEDIKESFKKIPQKAAYILASRDGDIQKKVGIINSSHSLKMQEIINRIQEEFPSNNSVKESSTTKLIKALRDLTHKIHVNQNFLSEYDKRELISIKNLLDEISN